MVRKVNCLKPEVSERFSIIDRVYKFKEESPREKSSEKYIIGNVRRQLSKDASDDDMLIRHLKALRKSEMVRKITGLHD